MKKRNLLWLLIAFLFATNTKTQLNYVDQQYNFVKEASVLYGVDNQYNGANTNLYMDIYKPVGDNNTSRLILMFIHGGGFVQGTRQEMDQMCIDFAKRGYVTATIDYRLGFYQPSFYHHLLLTIRQRWCGLPRAVQDAHGAMRFLKGRAAQDSSNVNLAFVGGASAGSITAMHMTYVDKLAEEPPAAGSISNVVTNTLNVPRPALGSIFGVLNQNGQNSQVQAVVNIFGALLDTLLIETANDVPLFSYHQTGDPVVACDNKKGLWGMPLGIGQNYPYLYGSCSIEPRMQTLGFTAQHYQSIIYTGNTHGIHDAVLLDTTAAIFLAQRIQEIFSISIPESKQLIATVFPNPANNIITIQTNVLDGVTVSIYDAMGKLCFDDNVTSSEPSFNISTASLNSGLYTLKVTSNKSELVRKVLIIH
ncbi:MAG: T9SS type A sorting domain-containing protein [Bacteroidetes bacterium]|nr:T9SS type A sorting domain-containing protein [Bacteroidota bacterium]